MRPMGNAIRGEDIQMKDEFRDSGLFGLETRDCRGKHNSTFASVSDLEAELARRIEDHASWHRQWDVYNAQNGRATASECQSSASVRKGKIFKKTGPNGGQVEWRPL